MQRIGPVKQEKAIILGSIAIIYNAMEQYEDDEKAIDAAAVLYDEAGENNDYHVCMNNVKKADRMCRERSI